MSLREEILSAPKGTQARIIRETGLAKITVIRMLHHFKGSNQVALAIATAYGKPKRWHELVDPEEQK